MGPGKSRATRQFVKVLDVTFVFIYLNFWARAVYAYLKLPVTKSFSYTEKISNFAHVGKAASQSFGKKTIIGNLSETGSISVFILPVSAAFSDEGRVILT